MLNTKMLALATGIVLGAPIMSASALAADGATLYVEKTCIACHGPEGRAPAMNAYPKLNGQNEPYLMVQMTAIKDGSRSNAHSVAMKNIMHRVSNEEMATIAKWLAGIK
ncbi:c-type cytochrome [Pseudomonadota bacterium]